MQSDPKTIYKTAAEKSEGSEQLYKDIGNMVFKELYDMFRRPPSLIVKLRGVGSWYLRRQRMQIALEAFPATGPDLSVTNTNETLIRHENKKELHEIFKLRLKDYEDYIELRNQIRKERYGTQTLLEPPTGEEQSS
jgi:hypothetical protein